MTGGRNRAGGKERPPRKVGKGVDSLSTSVSGDEPVVQLPAPVVVDAAQEPQSAPAEPTKPPRKPLETKPKQSKEGAKGAQESQNRPPTVSTEKKPRATKKGGAKQESKSAESTAATSAPEPPVEPASTPEPQPEPASTPEPQPEPATKASEPAGPDTGTPSTTVRTERQRKEYIDSHIGARVSATLDQSSRNFFITKEGEQDLVLEIVYPPQTDKKARKAISNSPTDVVIVNYKIDHTGQVRFLCVPAEQVNGYIETQAQQATASLEQVVGQTVKGRLEISRNDPNRYVMMRKDASGKPQVLRIFGSYRYPELGTVEELAAKEFSATVVEIRDNGKRGVQLDAFRDLANGAVTELPRLQRAEYIQHKHEQWNRELARPDAVVAEIMGRVQMGQQVELPRQAGRRFVDFEGVSRAGVPYTVKTLKPFRSSHELGQRTEFPVRMLGKTEKGAEAMFEHDFQLYLGLDAYASVVEQHLQLFNALDEKKPGTDRLLYDIGKIRNAIFEKREQIMQTIIDTYLLPFHLPPENTQWKELERDRVEQECVEQLQDAQQLGDPKMIDRAQRLLQSVRELHRRQRDDAKYTNYVEPLNDDEYMGLVQTLSEQVRQLEQLCRQCEQQHPEMTKEKSRAILNGDALLMEFKNYQEQKESWRNAKIQEREELVRLQLESLLDTTMPQKKRLERYNAIARRIEAITADLLRDPVYDAYPILASMVEAKDAYEMRFPTLRGLAEAGGEYFLQFKAELAQEESGKHSLELQPFSTLAFVGDSGINWQERMEGADGKLQMVMQSIEPGDTLTAFKLVGGNMVECTVMRDSVDANTGKKNTFTAVVHIERNSFLGMVREGRIAEPDDSQEDRKQKMIAEFNSITRFADVMGFLADSVDDPLSAIYSVSDLFNRPELKDLQRDIFARIDALAAEYFGIPENDLTMILVSKLPEGDEPCVTVDLVIEWVDDSMFENITLYGDDRDAQTIAAVQEAYAAAVRADSAAPGLDDSAVPEDEPELPATIENIFEQIDVEIDRENLDAVYLSFSQQMSINGELTTFDYLQIQSIDDDARRVVLVSPEGIELKMTFDKVDLLIQAGVLSKLLEVDAEPIDSEEASALLDAERQEPAFLQAEKQVVDWFNAGAKGDVGDAVEKDDLFMHVRVDDRWFSVPLPGAVLNDDLRDYFSFPPDAANGVSLPALDLVHPLVYGAGMHRHDPQINDDSGKKGEFVWWNSTSPQTETVAANESAPRNGIILGRDKSVSMESMYASGRMGNGMEYIGGSDAGLGKKTNEDRAVINSLANEAVVIDGMGGMGSGDIAADIIAVAMADTTRTPEQRIERAVIELHNAIEDGRIKHERAGAPFSYVQIKPDGRSMDIFWAGDTRVVVASADGKGWSTGDHSEVQSLIVRGLITEDQALTHPDRATVLGAIQATTTLRDIQIERDVALRPGDRIMIMSDGVSDNFTPKELVDMVQGKTMAEAYAIVNKETMHRMQYELALEGDSAKWHELQQARYQGRLEKYPDGYRSMPKGDNRSLVIIDIPANVDDVEKPSAPSATRTPEAPPAPTAQEARAQQGTNGGASVLEEPVKSGEAPVPSIESKLPPGKDLSTVIAEIRASGLMREIKVFSLLVSLDISTGGMEQAKKAYKASRVNGLLDDGFISANSEEFQLAADIDAELLDGDTPVEQLANTVFPTWEERARRIARSYTRIAESAKKLAEQAGSSTGMDGGNEFGDATDPLYADALKFVQVRESVRPNDLQRAFKIGYNRAARLIDIFVENGVVGPQEAGTDMRKVLARNPVGATAET